MKSSNALWMMCKNATLHRTLPFKLFTLTSFALLLLILGACSQLPVANTWSDNKKLYEQRLLLLQSIATWRIQGKISVTKNGKNNAGSLQWLHNPDTYQLTMTGPFDQGKLKIEGTPYQAFATINGNSNVLANNLNELFAVNLGWPIPAQQLQHWVRGIVRPDNLATDSQYAINDQGHVTRFMHQNWEVNLTSYKPFTGLLPKPQTDKPVWLPTKITLAGNNMNVKIIIKQWLSNDRPSNDRPSNNHLSNKGRDRRNPNS